MILKVCAFNPGLGWRKNTQPLLAITRTKVVRMIMGESSAKTIIAEMKSATGFIVRR
jgi:hypothetical protein